VALAEDPALLEATILKVYDVSESNPVNRKEVDSVVSVVDAGDVVIVYKVAGGEAAGKDQDKLAAPSL